MEEVNSSQSRPLDAVYPIVYLDALMVKNSRNGPRPQQGDLRGHWRQHAR